MDSEGYASLRVQVEGATKLEPRKMNMARVLKGDSIMLAIGDEWQITSEHAPTTRVGKLLARFFAPVESITVRVASIKVVDGTPCARLEVVAITS